MLRTRPLVQRRRRIVRNGLLAGLTAFCGAVGYHAVTGSGLNPVDLCGLFIAIAAPAVGIADFFRPQDAPSDPGALADDLAERSTSSGRTRPGRAVCATRESCP
ncbi:hypothetical protein [Streptomyces syringium]|uniref:hypothetical protein n=1 Tax=Streptomyces syringium TaxID=76729 RepID=UPI0033CBCE03